MSTGNQLLPNSVSVTFEGLMILHQHNSHNHYELGIYSTASGHRFEIFLDGHCVDVSAALSNRIWSLEVVQSNGTVRHSPVTKVDGNHDDRFDKSQAGASDLSW